jgi:DNA-directed DNA polymerase III PolC
MNFTDKFKDIDLEIHGVRLPSLEIEQEAYGKFGIHKDVSNKMFLRQLARTGFKKLNIEKNSEKFQEYVDRAKYELEIFEELGFVDYILLVWDVINYCSDKDIPTGLGRGSAAGSLILYLIGVTKLDPIKYGLYFERFVSKVRAKSVEVEGVTYLDGSLMCDVDMDICYYRRNEVITYLEDKFAGKTSKILTFNTLSSKLLIKEVGKVAGGFSEQEVNQISKLIPKDAGKVADIEEAIEQEPDLKEWFDNNPLLLGICRKLKNLNKNKGVHPAGQLISYSPMEEICPIELSSDKNLVSAYDMNWVSMFNVKLDLLGLRGVSVIDDVCKQIGIKQEDIDLDDPIIYQNLQNLKAEHGLFQIEADLAHQVVNKVKPKNLEELSAVLALARPGAMAYIDQYANYTNNGHYEPIHEFFDDILKPTGGVCLYQEQLMRMVNKIGFSLDDSELVRRCVGKKKIEEMAKWEQKISDKIKEQGLDPKIAEVLWEIAEASAKYQFNKSHSLCYAAIAAITVYLKHKYPQQFFLSLLKMANHEPDPTSEIFKIQKEMHLFNLKLLPPSLQKSKMHFSIDNKDIRYGLTSIKGISDKSAEKLEDFRGEYPNKFELFEAANSSGINRGVLAALIQAGCFEDNDDVTKEQVDAEKFLGKRESRSYCVYQSQLWAVLTAREKVIAKELGKECGYSVVEVLKKMASMKNDKGKPIIKESRLQTIRKESANFTQIFDQNKKFEALANWWYESKLLGYSYSSSLREIVKESGKVAKAVPIKNLKEGRVALFAGIVSEKVKITKSKKGKRYAKIMLKDEGEEIKVMLFEPKVDELPRLPEVDEICLVKGPVIDDGLVFADIVSIQSAKIFTKLIDLKKLEKLNKAP